MKQQVLRNGMILLGLSVSFLNIYYLTRPPTELVQHFGTSSQHTQTIQQSSSLLSTQSAQGVQIGADFFQSHKVVEESSLSLPKEQYDRHQQVHYPQHYSKVLIGIITSDTFNDYAYRKRHRELVRIWKDSRLCSLGEYQLLTRAQQHSSPCRVLYTFVMGGADPMDATAPTELLTNTTARPIERPKPVVMTHAKDCNDNDMTLLNIRENMNEGKSQTFFYWAGLILEEYHLDYAMKLDADAILHLHDFLLFVDTQLPPPPYNVHVTAGALRSKAGWAKHPEEEWARYESYFATQYEGVHLYLAGQCYIVSKDLCHWIAQEAPYSRVRIAHGGYLEGHEDHDILAMVFHSASQENPIHTVTIGKGQRFWEHPVKGLRRWERIVKRETARMAQTEFEGKMLRLY